MNNKDYNESKKYLKFPILLVSAFLEIDDALYIKSKVDKINVQEK